MSKYLISLQIRLPSSDFSPPDTEIVFLIFSNIFYLHSFNTPFMSGSFMSSIRQERASLGARNKQTGRLSASSGLFRHVSFQRLPIIVILYDQLRQFQPAGNYIFYIFYIYILFLLAHLHAFRRFKFSCISVVHPPFRQP